MTARTYKTLAKVAAVAFTSLIAPVAVNVVVGGMRPEARRQLSAGDRVSESGYRPPAAESGTGHASAASVIARGTGRTPDEALQTAALAAVRHALAVELDSGSFANLSPTVLDGVKSNLPSVISNWRERSATREWTWAGTVYRCEVEAEINLGELRGRLRPRDSSVRLAEPRVAKDLR
jgi:hypothetical protein